MFNSRLPDALIGDPDHLALRRLEPRDLPDMRGVLRDPDVARWYGDPDGALEGVEEHIDSTYVSAFVIIVQGTPAGYFQAYHANADRFWQNFGVPHETFGMDLAIGTAAHRGRGLGRRAIMLMVKRLFQMPEITRLQIDPDPENLRAVRAYAACGFISRGEFPGYEPGGTMNYMTIERPG